MGEPILNLSAWIDRRREEVGPYADHIVHSVKAYEARITALEEERDRLREAIDVLCRVVTGYQDSLHPMVKDQIDRTRAALEGE